MAKAVKASPQQCQALAKQAGIDWSKIDFQKVFEVIQMLISLFGSSGGSPAAVKAALGCTDDCAAKMHEAICHSLQSAHLCLECCCTTP